MALVTLTDHNTIDGVLEMLAKGLPGVFISSEITTTFPEDGCNVHVTVLNMTEAQFQEVMRLRRNIYDMVTYVRQEMVTASQDPKKNQLEYFITHPLMSTQNRPYGREGALSINHIEKAILLCHCLEVRNGTRTRHLNETTSHLIKSLTPEIIERLANKHNIAPWGDTPWKKAIVGGSDDHSGLNPGETFTYFPTYGKPLESLSVNDLIHAIRRRETSPDGAHDGPITLAHAVVKLMYDHQFETQRKTDVKTIRLDGPLNTLLQFAFDSASISLVNKIRFKLRSLEKKLLALSTQFFDIDQKFESILSQLALELISDNTFQNEISKLTKTDDKIFMIISRLLNRIFLLLDRWVDPQHYHPRNRKAGFWQDYGLADEDRKVKYIYVGRVSVEKDLQTLAEAYKKLYQTNSQAHLIIVGNGPYLNEIKQQLEGYPVIYTGFLEGQDLARAYASADVKVFPSTTDTWGYSALEAQASGLPVIVSDKGGPQELIEEGITGYRVRGKDVDSLVEAMMKLMDDRTRVKMGQKARQFIEENNIEEPFTAIFCAEEYRRRDKQMRKMKKHLQTQQHALDAIVRIGHIQESDEIEGHVNYAL